MDEDIKRVLDKMADAVDAEAEKYPDYGYILLCVRRDGTTATTSNIVDPKQEAHVLHTVGAGMLKDIAEGNETRFSVSGTTHEH